MASATTVHEPSTFCNGWSNMASRYVVTVDQVNNLLHELNDPNFINNLSKLFSSPIDNIISLMAYPFDVSAIFTNPALNDTSIIIGINVMQTTGKYIAMRTPPLLSLGQVTLGRFFNNFLDFAPYTKVEIYLPFIGFEMLDTDLVMGKTIKVRYAVDLYTGKCTAFVLAAGGGSEHLIMTRDGQCGMPIQVAGGNGAEMARNMLKFGVSAVGDAVKLAATSPGTPGAAGYLASTTVGAINAFQHIVHKGGHQESLTSGYGPLMANLIVTRPVIAEPSSYAHNYGRPCGKTLPLSACSGFTQVDAVHVEGSGFATATIGERDEIERLLKTGVLL